MKTLFKIFMLIGMTLGAILGGALLCTFALFLCNAAGIATSTAAPVIIVFGQVVTAGLILGAIWVWCQEILQ